MSQLLWGKVYYQNTFAGFLRQEPGHGSSFCYDSSYLQTAGPAIAHALPLQAEPFVFQNELPPFFDNLVAEGWMEEAQSRLLGKRLASRFELLLAFGYDCIGAVSVIDPNPENISKALIDVNDPRELALLTSRASLSGVQPKLAIVKKSNKYFPANIGELSTHIAKFPSRNHNDLVTNEYLTTIAYKELLPNDACVEMSLGEVQGISDPALIITRFDRAHNKRIHFEEFNQLLNYPANAKYFGEYKTMADFIRKTPKCLRTEIYTLYLRTLAGILLGNTDMHLKNFAMFHTQDGLRLTPTYDQVAAYLYGYKQLALIVNGTENILLNKLSHKNIIDLGVEFGLNKQAIDLATETLRNNIPAAKQAILDVSLNNEHLQQQLVDLIDKTWQTTFV